MVKAKKQDIDVKLIIDSREQDISYIKNVLDKRVGVDGIKIKEYEVKAVKPNNCHTSTGDITIEIKVKDSKMEYIPTKLCIELKKSGDNFSSLYLKTNKDRLFNEIKRANEYDLDFYFIITDDFTETINRIKKIPKFAKGNVENSYFEAYFKLEDELIANNFRSPIISGKDLAWTIRRVIKRFIKENKLQYIEESV